MKKQSCNNAECVAVEVSAPIRKRNQPLAELFTTNTHWLRNKKCVWVNMMYLSTCNLVFNKSKSFIKSVVQTLTFFSYSELFQILSCVMNAEFNDCDT